MVGQAQRWHHRPGAQAALAWLAASYIRLLHATSRAELHYPPATAALLRARTPFIGAFWHGRMLMMNGGWRALLRELQVERPLQTCVISSDHRDGRLMARATARLGVETVFGSTKRGRASLIKAARGALERGWVPLFTPDGPRGPRMRVKPGVIRLAMATGVPILPGSFAATNQRLLDSWDRFAVVLPGARCVFAFGPPLAIAPDGDAEAARLALEHCLNELTATADRALGVATVMPED